jgi:hypothetical protein
LIEGLPADRQALRQAGASLASIRIAAALRRC